MMQLTIERARGDMFLPPLIIANAAHKDQIAAQLEEIAAGDATLILEPMGRNTAPAIALAALTETPDASLLVMPSDHVIRDADAFRTAVAEAAAFLEKAYLVTFGITPDVPETGFGYIKAAEPLAGQVMKVERFVEKPDFDTATRYLAEGGYYWNAGIFLFRAGDFLAALEQHAPDVLHSCRDALSRGTAAEGIIVPEASAFSRSPSISVDYAVMEKAQRVAVRPVSIGWSDIGSWDALNAYLEADGRAGASSTDLIEIDSRGCFIKSDGPTVAVIGVDDIIVVATQSAVLVVPKGQSQKVKDVVDALRER
jgi:mannose-1-phosphate guanylyltransferase/mannose-1-phosphate guanylyltransferase/mannose-6-phosphate isomerase